MENRIQELREEHDMTQVALAQALGVTRQTINAVERNRYDPQLELAFKLAEFFECDVDDLFQSDFDGIRPISDWKDD